MSDRESKFKVKFEVDRSEEQAALKASKGDYAAIEGAAKAAIKAATDGHAKAAEAAKAAGQAAKQAAREAAQAAKAAEKEGTEAAKKEAAERAKIAKEADVARRASVREAVRAARELASAQAQGARVASQAQKLANEELKRTTAFGQKAVGVLTSIGGTVTGIQGLASVIALIPEAFDRAKNQALEAGKFVEDYRKQLRELAFLKGAPGATAGVVAEDLGFRSRTLQDSGSSRAVQEEFRNMAGVAIDSDQTRRKMTEADATAAMIFAGQMQSMYGGDAGAYGKLAGMVPSLEKSDRVSGDQVKQRLAQLMKISEKGGASPAQFAEQLAPRRR